MRKNLAILLVLLMFSFAVYSEGQQEAGNDNKLIEWEQAAQLGEFRPAEDNWAEIEAKAKEEGTVVVWSNSSKVFTFCKGFYNKYKIKSIPNDLGTGSLFEKLRREQQAGIYSTDMVLTSGVAELYNDFMPNKSLYKFIPRDVEKVLIPQAKEDHLLGVQRFGGKMIAYNLEAKNGKCPVDSWWDLTRPEWKGRIIMKDPMLGGSELYLMVTFVGKADEMAANYKEEFGEDIVLNGTENAGYEYVKRLLANEVILMKGGSPVAEAVGAKGQKSAPLGIISPSKMKLNEEANLALGVAWDIKPFSIFVTSQALGISKYAKNPNAAKLMIKWVYGDENRGGGFKPFDLEGTWSARGDVKDTKNDYQFSGLELWTEDPAALYENSVYLRDFWIQNM